MARLFLALFVFASVATAKVVEDGDAVFFPPSVADTVHTFKSFPVFWWNFLVLSYADEATGLRRAKETCALLSSQPALFERVECSDDLSRYLPLVRAWSADVVVRQPPPDRAALRKRLDEALARASLPLPRTVLEVLRIDPLGEHQTLLERAKKRLKLELARVDGFFLDRATKRIVIPVQPSFPPEQSAKLAPLKEQLADWTFIGPHGATLENKSRIFTDLERVSLAGTILLVLFAAFLAWRREWRLCILFPPVFLATALAAATVRLLFGSVHGLTLAFGFGIIGLTIDYGLHLAYATDPRRVWRSNLAGFATTMVCLLVLMFSDVPLLRQLMIFSAVGFSYSYFLLWLTQRLWPRAFQAQPLPVRLRTSRWRVAAVSLFLAGVIPGLAVVRPALDLRQLDYQTPQTAKLTEWFFTQSTKMRPLFEPVRDGGLEKAVAAATERESWLANRTDISLESPAGYVPALATRQANVAAWKKTLCEGDTFESSLSDSQRKFFAPFLASVRCSELDARVNAVVDAPYLNHLRSGSHWLMLWLPGEATASAAVESAYPEARSLLSVVSAFPKLLAAEMRWMGPLSLLFVFVILAVHFGSFKLAAIGLLPFLAGAGAVAWRSLLLNDPPSFVTLVGLVMTLGLSVDYAIFAIDFLRHHQDGTTDDREENGAGTALAVSAITTVVGFLPLVFCEHRVLAHLGWALTLGTLGTVACAGWGIPALRRQIQRGTAA